jgi:3-oxoacyl-[acyl-carrier-protein] synthase II
MNNFEWMRPDGTHRVVVVSSGMVTPLGVGTIATRNAVRNGKSGIRRITQFDPADFPVKIAGEVPHTSEALLSDKDRKDFLTRTERYIHLMLPALQEVMQSVLRENGELLAESRRAGAVIGSGQGGLPEIFDVSFKFGEYSRLSEEEREGFPNPLSRKVTGPFFIAGTIVNQLVGVASMRYGLRGYQSAPAMACASGLHAIQEAYYRLRYAGTEGMQWFVAGGSESVITPLSVAGFTAAGAMSKSTADPRMVSCPFSANASGFVLSEGCGLVGLATYQFARRNNLPILGEILGAATTSDAHSMAAPHPDGRGAYDAVLSAMLDAEIAPEVIGYVNAHATSTPAGDPIEYAMLERVFSDSQHKPVVDALKGHLGHMIGAAGSVEFALALDAMLDGTSYGIMNYDDNYASGKHDLVLSAQPSQLKQYDGRLYGLKTSFAFGGVNVAIIMATM